jgi:hypothetical protein
VAIPALQCERQNGTPSKYLITLGLYNIYRKCAAFSFTNPGGERRERWVGGPLVVSAGAHQVGEIVVTGTHLPQYIRVIGGDCAPNTAKSGRGACRSGLHEAASTKSPSRSERNDHR